MGLFEKYLLIVNMTALLMYGLDKVKAICSGWRIPEMVLLALAAIGGSAGALIGMLAFRHKIRKPVFMAAVPAFLILQIAGYIFIK